MDSKHLLLTKTFWMNVLGLAATVGGLQRLPRQQPAGQEAPSQRHAPFMQRCPAAHGGPPPHRHAPEIEQLSAFPGSQLAQAAAATPHVNTERG